MNHLWIPEIPIWEKILRSAVVYLFILLAFRFTGKRQVGQLTPFDLVVLLIISNVVQNAVIGNDNSLGGGIIGAIVILLLNWIVVLAAYRFKPFRRVMAGEPTLLVHNGRVFQDRMEREHISMEDLNAALRKNGVVDTHQVRFAVLEENGQISVIPKSN
ncbi:MAG TPA: YetF domain-containing protein [bacterium]|nr:YetF domain-containing protein [bacterium]